MERNRTQQAAAGTNSWAVPLPCIPSSPLHLEWPWTNKMHWKRCTLICLHGPVSSSDLEKPVPSEFRHFNKPWSDDSSSHVRCCPNWPRAGEALWHNLDPNTISQDLNTALFCPATVGTRRNSGCVQSKDCQHSSQLEWFGGATAGTRSRQRGSQEARAKGKPSSPSKLAVTSRSTKSFWVPEGASWMLKWFLTLEMSVW